jgi:uncharacterized protein
MALPRRLKNFLLYNQGLAYLGEVPELKLPALKRKMEDYRAGGMLGPIKTDMGMEGMELDWTSAGFLPDVLGQFGAPKHDSVGLRFAGSLQSDDSEATHAIEVVMRGRHTEVDFGSAKAGDKTEIKVKTALSYYQLSLDGVVLVEIDLVNNIEVIGGVDLGLGLRLALGI